MTGPGSVSSDEQFPVRAEPCVPDATVVVDRHQFVDDTDGSYCQIPEELAVASSFLQTAQFLDQAGILAVSGQEIREVFQAPPLDDGAIGDPPASSDFVTVDLGFADDQAIVLVDCDVIEFAGNRGRVPTVPDDDRVSQVPAPVICRPDQDVGGGVPVSLRHPRPLPLPRPSPRSAGGHCVEVAGFRRGAGRVAESGVFSLEAEGGEVEFIGPDATFLFWDFVTVVGVAPRFVDETLRGVDIADVPKADDTGPSNVSDDVAGGGPRILTPPHESFLRDRETSLCEEGTLFRCEGGGDTPVILDILPRELGPDLINALEGAQTGSSQTGV